MLNASKIKNEGGGNKVAQPNLEVGGYPARVVRILDFGLQPQDPWKGQEKPPANMMQVTYEIIGEFMIDEDGNEVEDKPRWVSEDFALYPLEVDRAKSTIRYNAIDPTNLHKGDWAKLLGMPVTVNIIHNVSKTNKQTYDNVGSLSSIRAKVAETLGDLVNQPFVVSMEDVNTERFEALHSFFQDKMTSSLDWETTPLYKALNGDKPKEPADEKAGDDAEPSADEEDEIPF